MSFAPSARGLVLLGALMVATIFAVAGLLTASQRADSLTESKRATDNLAQVLIEQTSRTIQPVDLALRDIQARVTAATAAGLPSATTEDLKATYDLLVERLKTLPQVDALMIFSAEGRLVNYSRALPPVPLDASARDYYQYFSTHDDHGLFVSAPVKAYIVGTWVVLLGRRINDARGAFAGIVTAAVTLAYLEDFYRAVTPQDGSVALLRRDGLLLARYPPVEGQIGKKLPPQAPWYSLMLAGGGSYITPGYVDDQARVVSARPLRDFPLVIDVTTTVAAALSAWRQQMLATIAGATLAAAFVCFLLWLFGTQFRRLAGKNEELETAHQRFDTVLDNMSQGITFFDGDQRLMVYNRRYTEIYRLSPDQVHPGISLAEIVEYNNINGSCPDMTTAEFLARRRDFAAAGTSFDVVDLFRNGRMVSLHYQPLPTGGWVVTHEDITERRRTEAAMVFMACHDGLTKLPNRTLFQERLTEAIAGTRRGGHCALLCLDLDRFKVVNDTLGHPAGDSLLCAVGARLLSLVRDGDTVARLGGDEFAVVLAGLKSPRHAAILADRIVRAFGEPFDIDGHRIMAATSIGVSVAPKDGNLSDTLMKSADVALYLAKAEGRGTYRFFEPEIDQFIQRRRAIELDLRNALPAKDFVLHYQPVVDLGTGRVSGFEALLRWQHPIRGMVSPDTFIPIAEETGLIVPIGAWVLRKACQDAAAWPDDIEIAVNISPVQFKRGEILEVVQEALDASGLAPSRLELEITESTLMENSSDRLAVLRQLRALGIRLALDDFGTGYSSLSYLRSFPFDKVKIDRSFIRDLETDKDAVAIVGAIVGLARSLRMTTVAEGVETPQQLATVRDQGCAKVQGYLFSRPRPVDEALGLIRSLRADGPFRETGPVREIGIAEIDPGSGRRRATTVTECPQVEALSVV